jgi:hypothetical protein
MLEIHIENKNGCVALLGLGFHSGFAEFCEGIRYTIYFSGNPPKSNNTDANQISINLDRKLEIAEMNLALATRR